MKKSQVTKKAAKPKPLSPELAELLHMISALEQKPVVASK